MLILRQSKSTAFLLTLVLVILIVLIIVIAYYLGCACPTDILEIGCRLNSYVCKSIAKPYK